MFADIIAEKDWKEFTLIYEGAEYLPFFDNILTMEDMEDEHVVINVIQLPDGDDYRCVYY